MQSCGNIFYRYLAAGLLLLPLACAGAPDPTGTSGAVPLDAALGLDRNDLPAGTAVEDCLGLTVPDDTTHRAMLDALNLYRIQNGLNPLRYSARLQAAIDAHVRDLWARNFFDHVNPSGEHPSDRALNAGFCHSYVGENIAAGQTSVSAVMEAWKNSPGHNLNMLYADYAYVGVGFFIAPTGRMYWGQLFALDVP